MIAVREKDGGTTYRPAETWISVGFCIFIPGVIFVDVQELKQSC